MELAQAFQRLGSQVTILASRLLPHDDPEAVGVLRRVFEREGVRWLHGRAAGGDAGADGIVVSSDTGGAGARGDDLLVAAGRRPNVDGSRARSRRRRALRARHRRRRPTAHERPAHLRGRRRPRAASSSRTWPGGRHSRRRGTRLLPGSSSGRAQSDGVGHVHGSRSRAGGSQRDGRARSDSATRSPCTTWDIARVDRAKCDDDEDGFIKLIVESTRRADWRDDRGEPRRGDERRDEPGDRAAA